MIGRVIGKNRVESTTKSQNVQCSIAPTIQIQSDRLAIRGKVLDTAPSSRYQQL